MIIGYNTLFLPFICAGVRAKLLPRNKFYNVNSSFSDSSTSKSTLNLRGIYPPITTPFDNNEKISYENLKFNFQKWKSIPFRGYVVLGSTGEAVSLSNEERVEVVKFAREAAPKDKLIICGSGCQSTKYTIELTQKMADVGADAALVISPSFYKGRMTDDALYSHYCKVADASLIPIIIYSVPANTNIDLSASLICKLANHPNIIGLKDSGGDIKKIGLIVQEARGKGFQVLAGSAGFFYPALSVGCVGGVMALANILGESLCQVQNLSDNKKFTEAYDLQHRLISPNLCVTKHFGIAGVKSAMDLIGLYGGPTRSPLLPLTPAEAKSLAEEFRDYGFL